MKENSGWIGDVLCFMTLSQTGLTKDDLLRLLELRGYKDKLKVKCHLNIQLFLFFNLKIKL